jgi:hypothetical protein
MWGKKSSALVECDVFHMYTSQEVQVRPRVLKRVDHVMRYVRASSRLVVDPSAPQRYRIIVLHGECKGSCTHLSNLYGHCAAQLSIKSHGKVRKTNRIYVDCFQMIRIYVIRLLCTVGVERARNLKELPSDVRKKSPRRDPKGSVCAVSRSPIRDLVRLDLRSLNCRPNAALTLSLTHLSQERDEVL